MTFDKAEGYVDLPITVPCGRCVGCRLERSRQWAVRCMHEAQMHERTSFITLTYSKKNLPADGSLDVKHWQDFAKRLRKKKGPFKFYHCGEYGDSNYRPHYHAAIFGIDWVEDRKLYTITKQGNRLFTSAELDETWQKGNVWIGNLSFESAAYVARYIMKKVNGDQAEAHYQWTDRTTGEIFTLKPEYTTMSRRPGLGSTWFEKYYTDVFPSDEVIIRGRSMRPPKYYDSLLEKRDPLLFKKIKAKRKKEATKYEDDNTYTRLIAKEKVKLAEVASLSRNI